MSSFVSVFLAVFLSIVGLSLWKIRPCVDRGLLTSTLLNLITGFLANCIGRRRMLVIFGLIATFSGAVFAYVSNPIVLILVAVISMLRYRGGFGPVNMLERVILAQCCRDEMRTCMYAIRSTLNSIAISTGSLFTGIAILLQTWFSLTELSSYKAIFGVYAIINLIMVLLYSQLSKRAEIEVVEKTEVLPLSPETRRKVLKFSFLFSLDSFGGGLITSSLVSYWFFVRFGLGINVIGLVFSVSSLLSAASFMLAARISKHIDLINTMVYSHLHASMMTMSIPYMPTFAASATLYFSRALLSQMDVPTRQSYVMAIVKPEERSQSHGSLTCREA